MKEWKLINFCEFDPYATKAYCAIHNEKESKNLGDITKVDETKLEEFNFICGGSPCFLKGEIVNTINGFKNIEDIKVGEYVKSHDGTYQKVISSMKNTNNQIYDIKCGASHNINTTFNHPFYILRDGKKIFKEAYELTTNDFMMIPINKTQNECDWNGYERRLNQSATTLKKNLPIKDYRFWYLIGRFLGDGWVKNRNKKMSNEPSSLIVCCSKDELEELKDKLGDVLKYNITEDRTTYRLQFTNKELALFCSKFGHGAKNKFIPQSILDIKKEYLEHLLEGIIDSDGCFSQNKYKITTISKNLAYNIGELVLKVKQTPYHIYKTIRPNTHIIEGRVVNQNNTFQITWSNNETCNKNLSYVDEDYMYSKIRQIEHYEDMNDVYNLEVENTHTYCVQNIATHNCQDFSVAGKQKGSVWKCQECGEEFNPIMVHWSKRDECPHCHSKNLDKSRSSLLVEWLRIIRANKPNFGLYENVKNIIGKKFEPTFNAFIKELNEYGYNTYYQVMNAREYGVPQNRERVFVLIIKRELDNGKFKFPNKTQYKFILKDILKQNVESKWYLTEKQLKSIKNSSYIQNQRRIQQKEYVDTLCARDWKDPKCIEIDGKVRKIIPLEYFRLMDFDKDDFYKAQMIGLSNTQLYKQAGNSIVVNIPYKIFKSLHSAMPYLFDDLKVGSYFSGIGAIEKALNRLYDDINNNKI